MTVTLDFMGNFAMIVVHQIGLGQIAEVTVLVGMDSVIFMGNVIAMEDFMGKIVKKNAMMENLGKTALELVHVQMENA